MTPDRFRECLTRLRFSTRGLADVLGCDDRMVRRWSAGRVPIPAEIVAWLGQAADVPEPTPDWRRGALPASFTETC